MVTITAVQERILKALARYKYLTASQIVELGICNLTTARQYISALQKYKLTKKTIYSQPITVNTKNVNIRLEGLNFLDIAGVKLLKDNFDLDNIKYPQKYKLSFSNDYFHRIFMVSSCIAFDKWLTNTNQEGFFLVDFHNSETTVKITDTLTVKPDIIIDYNGTKCIVEVWAGIEKEYIVNQLSKFYKAVASRKINEHLKYDRGIRILNIFKDKPTLERVKQELMTDSYFAKANAKGLFLFATLEEVKADFDCFKDIRGVEFLLI
jgi:hypothetical protein